MQTSSGTSGSRILGAGRTTAPAGDAPRRSFLGERRDPLPAGSPAHHIPSPYIPPPQSPTVSRPFSPKTAAAWREYFMDSMLRGRHPNDDLMPPEDVAAFYRSQGMASQDTPEEEIIRRAAMYNRESWLTNAGLRPPRGGYALMDGVSGVEMSTMGQQGSTNSSPRTSTSLGSTSRESRANLIPHVRRPHVRRTMLIDPVGVHRTSSGRFRASQGNRARRTSPSSSLSGSGARSTVGQKRRRVGTASTSRSSGTTTTRSKAKTYSDSSYDLRPSPSTSRSSTTSSTRSTGRSVRQRPTPQGRDSSAGPGNPRRCGPRHGLCARVGAGSDACKICRCM